MNMNALMQQAQRMQKDLEKKQTEINESEYTGESQLVTIVLKGDKTLKSVTIKDKENFDIEDLEILEDMFKIAHNEAMKKIKSDVEAKMGPYAKQLGGLI